MPEYKEMIEKGGSIPEASTPAELGKIIIQTRDEVASTIMEFGLQQDFSDKIMQRTTEHANRRKRP